MTENPRICEVLGVEQGVPFTVGELSDVFIINADGRFAYANEGAMGLPNLGYLIRVMHEAINHPESIIRKPRWTEAELRDMETFMLLLGDDHKIRRAHGKVELLFGIICDDGIYDESFRLGDFAFPSLKPGETINIHDELRKAGRV